MLARSLCRKWGSRRLLPPTPAKHEELAHRFVWPGALHLAEPGWRKARVATAHRPDVLEALATFILPPNLLQTPNIE